MIGADIALNQTISDLLCFFIGHRGNSLSVSPAMATCPRFPMLPEGLELLALHRTVRRIKFRKCAEERLVGLNFGSKFQPRLCHSDKTLTRFQRLCTFGKSRAARHTFKRLGWGLQACDVFVDLHTPATEVICKITCHSRDSSCAAQHQQVTAVRSDQDRYHGKRRARRPLCRKLLCMGLFWEKAGGSTFNDVGRRSV